MVAINEAEGTKVIKLARKVTRTMRSYSTFKEFLMTVLNFFIAFGEELKERFAVFRIFNSVNDFKGSDLLTKMSAQSYYRYI